MIYPLTRAKHLLQFFPIGLRYQLFGTLLVEEKILRQEANASFLTTCRRKHFIPNFIQNMVRTHTFRGGFQHSHNQKRLQYMKRTLNLKIREAFSHLHYLRREQTQKEANLQALVHHNYSDQKILCDNFISEHKKKIAFHIHSNNKATHRKKLRNLTVQDDKDHQQNHLVLTPQPNRVTTIGQVDLPSEATDLLKKGAKFALPPDLSKPATQKEILRTSEVNIERFLYAVRTSALRTNGILNLPSPPPATAAHPNDAEPSPTPPSPPPLPSRPQSRNLPTTSITSQVDPGIFLKRPEAFKSQPPPLKDPQQERMLTELKQELMAEVRRSINLNKQTLHPTVDQKKAKKILKAEGPHLVIKQSDKDKQFVVTEKQTYVKHVEEMLSDTQTYQAVSRNPLPNMKTKIESLCKSLGRKHPWIIDNCEPYLPRLPEFYASYKTHKNINPPPLRPVVSQVDSPAERLAHIANYILTQVVEQIPTNVKSSFNLKRDLLNTWTGAITENHYLVTADVKSLYTSIPLEHGQETVVKFLDHNSHAVDMMGLNIQEFSEILEAVLQGGYFRFNDTFWHQKKGVGMGVKPAPPFAIIYVYCVIELPLLSRNYTYLDQDQPPPEDLPEISSYHRYIDDCLLLIKTEAENNIEILFRYINSLNEDIQFTYEHSKQKIAFLDLQIHINPTERNLEFGLYVKPSKKNIFMDYHSHHPRHQILNTAENEICRAIKNSSTEDSQVRSIQLIREMLQQNNFPAQVINRLTKKAKRKIAYSPQNQKETKDHVLALPFLTDGCSRNVKKVLDKRSLLSRTRVVFRSGTKLQQHFSRSALLPTTCNARGFCYDCDDFCMRKNFVYLIKCALCQGEEYVGQSGRMKRMRCNEHFKSVKFKTNNTAIGKHFLNMHPDLAIDDTCKPFEFKILKTCKDYPDRLLWESTFIKELTPSLNVQLTDHNEWRKKTWAIL